MRISAVLGTLFVLSASAAFALPPRGDDCRHGAERKATSPAAGITRVVIHGTAGFLHVEGRPNVAEITAMGRACTSDRDFLDDITLTARRSGSELHIDAHIPEKVVIFGFFEARLDFGVVVPQNVPIVIEDGSGSLKVWNIASADVEDGSGSMNIRNVSGSLQIRDGSGEIEIEGVGGNVEIEDGSGEIVLRGVTGNVEIEDGSGDIDIARVGGAVTIGEDGSGSIEIEQVKRSVVIDDDGSGSINVADIGGDFLVHRKGSGVIHDARVAGKVSVPRD